jgi:hypothetical protein
VWQISEWFTWRNTCRFAGLVILAVELRQVLLGELVDQGLVLLAAGLLGIPSMFRAGAED